MHMVIIFQSAVSYAFDLCTCSFATGCTEGTSGMWLCTVRIQEITLYVGPFSRMCMLSCGSTVTKSVTGIYRF